MLFNLQGAHRSQRRVFILPQLFSFVKHFFQVFSNSFVLSFAGPCCVKRRPRGQPSYVTTLVFPCQALFQVFQTFSCSFLEKLGGERCPFGQLIEDITFGTFCQALFSSARLLRFPFETLNRFCLKAFRARAGSARL